MVATALLLISACAASPQEPAAPPAAQRQIVRLQGGGATFPNPVYQRWTTEFQKLRPHVRIDYQSLGTGAGIKHFAAGEFDFAGVDFGLTDADRRRMGDHVVCVPTVAGAVVVAYNLSGVEGQIRLTGDVIARVYLGEISRWNDPEIVALNPALKLPGLAITPAWRTDGSGTTWMFSAYLAGQNREFARRIGSGKQVEWPVGQGGKGGEGIPAVVQSTPGAIGYLEWNLARQNRIPWAALQNADGEFVDPSVESVHAAQNGAVEAMRAGETVSLIDQPGKRSYPICAFSYVALHRDLARVGTRDEAAALVEFLRWAIGDPKGRAIAAEMDYAPVGESIRLKLQDLLNDFRYDGKPLGPGEPPQPSPASGTPTGCAASCSPRRGG